MVCILLQNCLYIPPSLRSREVANRTPPSLGTRGYFEQKSARKSSGPGTLPVSKATNLKPHAAFGAGVQRKLDMDSKDLKNRNDKSVKSSVKQPKYQPPVTNGPCRFLPFPGLKNHSCLVQLFYFSDCFFFLLILETNVKSLLYSIHLPREKHSYGKRSSREVVQHVSELWQASNEAISTTTYEGRRMAWSITRVCRTISGDPTQPNRYKESCWMKSSIRLGCTTIHN